MAKRKKRPGRPAGTPAERRPVVEARPSRCPNCGSTERERYTRTTWQPIAGQTSDGEPFTHIACRWTRCSQCGQARVDRAFEQRGTEAPDVLTGDASEIEARDAFPNQQ